MGRCVVAGCKSRYSNTGKRINFFSFPNKETDSDRYSIWVKKCHRFYAEKEHENEEWQPPINGKICSLHFDNEAYDVNPIIEQSLGFRRRARTLLSKDAVPTIFDYAESDPPVPYRRKVPLAEESKEVGRHSSR